MVNVVLLGPPGSGKGTCCEFLVKNHGIVQLSTGEMLRAEAKAGTEVGNKAKVLMEAGKFVPDEVVVGVISARVDKPDCKAGFILDGFPRNVDQAEALTQMLKEKGLKLGIVVELRVPDSQVLIDRICGRFSCAKCGAGYHERNKKPKVANICDVCGAKDLWSRRKDDNETTLKSRLDAYAKQTAPLVEYYSKLGLLRVANAMQELKANVAEVNAIVNDVVNASSSSSCRGACAGCKCSGGAQNYELTVEMKARLKTLINTAPVTVFIKGSATVPRCKFSRKLIRSLMDNNVTKFAFFDILAAPDVREYLKGYTGRKTYPMLFINGKLFGGNDELSALLEDGNLAETLPEASFGSGLYPRIKEIVNRAAVVVLVQGSDPVSEESKALVASLQKAGVQFETFDVNTDEKVREVLKKYCCVLKKGAAGVYPMVFQAGELVGGLAQVQQGFKEGTLGK